MIGAASAPPAPGTTPSAHKEPFRRGHAGRLVEFICGQVETTPLSEAQIALWRCEQLGTSCTTAITWIESSQAARYQPIVDGPPDQRRVSMSNTRVQRSE
jgi:hypothetical protein